MTRYRRALATAVAAGVLASGIAVASAGVVAADYGPGATYQVELSANVGGRDGGGVWLWIALYPSGAGDYRGSDCGHGFGAVRDQGDVSWTFSGDSVVISGVALNGLGGFPTTITIPKAYGHYTGTVGTFLTLPGFIPPNIGNAQLQVAP